jgi:hypothetical protein
MLNTFDRRKGNFKAVLFVFGLIIIGLILGYTQHLVNLLEDKSREYLRFRIRVFEENINNPDANIDFNFFFTEVIQNADYPIVFTDPDMTPLQCRNISTKLDTMIIFSPEAISDLKEYLLSMDSDNPPIPIKYQGNVLGYYHYGVSPVIKQLRWLPYIEIAAAMLFIVIGYIGFSQIKKSEQRNIWVGMAKETAHQLGTPLSSMSGWLEILKSDSRNLDKAVREMDIDIQRLTKVAARFSQIGSVPSLKKTEILPMLENIIKYFNKRLPQLDKKITIAENFNIEPKLMINIDLFEWVIENLIKNAIDAIEGKQGKIDLTMDHLNGGPGIFIDVSDNGRGILPRDRKNIFKPGFSTKKRGWGLGLSLAKRIVEDYHGGKLFVKDSRLGEGTIFRIILDQNQ